VRVVDEDYDEPGVADALMGLSRRGGVKRSHEGSPDNDDGNKRSRMTSSPGSPPTRRPSSPSRRPSSPNMSSRPSPIPFRTQGRIQSPASHSSSEEVVTTLPPHPRPVGSSASSVTALPPITTLSPPPDEDKMDVDQDTVKGEDHE